MMRTIRTIAEAMRGNPLALALIVVNLIYVIAGIVIIREQQTRYANAIRGLIERCVFGAETRP